MVAARLGRHALQLALLPLETLLLLALLLQLLLLLPQALGVLGVIPAAVSRGRPLLRAVLDPHLVLRVVLGLALIPRYCLGGTTLTVQLCHECVEVLRVLRGLVVLHVVHTNGALAQRRVGRAACFSRAGAAACLAVLPVEEEEGVRQSPQRRTGGAVAPKNRGPAPKCAGERSLRSSRCGCCSRRARISNAGASRFHRACTAARARNGMAMGPHPKQGPAPKRTQGRSHTAQCCCGQQCAATTAAAPDVPASRAGVPAARVAAERMQPLAARPSRRRWGGRRPL